MPTEQWTDGRLNDLALEVGLIRHVVPVVAEHGVKIDNVESMQTRILTTLDRLDDKLDATSLARTLTPGQKLAAAVPIATSLVALAGVVVVGGP